MLQISYTLGKEVASNPYHVHVLSTQLTRNLHAILPEIRDEMSLAMQDHIPLTAEQGLRLIPLLHLILNIGQDGCPCLLWKLWRKLSHELAIALLWALHSVRMLTILLSRK